MNSQAAFQVRRAELRDVPGICQLIQEQQLKRFTNQCSLSGAPTWVSELIELLPFSVVAVPTDAHQEAVFGFLACGLDPPAMVSPPPASISLNDTNNNPRHQWIQDGFEMESDVCLANGHCMFLHSLFVDPLLATPFFYEALSALFVSAARVQRLFYFSRFHDTLFPPLSGPKYDLEELIYVGSGAGVGVAEGESVPLNLSDEAFMTECLPRSVHPLVTVDEQRAGSDGERNVSQGVQAHWKLYQVDRALIVPKLTVRRAKVEDCDDLIPLLKKYQILNRDADDYFLSKLIESTDPDIKTLVAVVNNRAIGFMSLQNQCKKSLLLENYHLEPYIPSQLGMDSEEEGGSRLKPTQHRKFGSVAALSRSIEQMNHGNTSAIEKPRDLADVPKTLRGSLQLTHKVSLTNLADVPALKNSDEGDQNENKEVIQQALKMNGADDEDAAKTQQQSKDILPAAFCITIFCIDRRFAGLAHEFLPEAFDAFPNKDICLITLPSTAAEPPLISQYFTFVPAKYDHATEHCLYVCNRFAIEETLQVRMATENDAEDIFDLIQDLGNEAELVGLLRHCKLNTLQEVLVGASARKNNRPLALVVEIRNRVIGLALLDHVQISTVLEQFDVEDFIAPEFHRRAGQLFDGYNNLKHFILNPLFLNHSRWIMMEILRLLQGTALLSLLDDSMCADPVSNNIILRELCPVRPRRQVEYPDSKKDGDVVPEKINAALQLFSVNLAFEPRLKYNTRLIMVGGSTTGKSFLNDIVMLPHLYFTQIVWLMEEQLDHEGKIRSVHENSSVDSSFIPSDCCFFPGELNQIRLKSRVNIVHGKLIEIDRNQKHVILKDGSVLSYDYLTMAPGFQFNPAISLPKFAQFANVLGVNASKVSEISDRVKRFAHTQYVDGADEDKIIVYGSDLTSYATVQYLLLRGIQPRNIVHVSPIFPQKSSPAFENYYVGTKMQAIMKSSGVQQMTANAIHGVDRDGETEAVEFETDGGESKTVKCRLFLYCHEKSPDPETFHALNSCSLVFDKKLVVGSQFQSNDKRILVAGPITKYSVRYDTNWSHAYYNSREVGSKLAQVVLQLFDPLSELKSTEHLPIFKVAKAVYTHLPGNYTFLHYDRPHLPPDYMDKHLADKQKIVVQSMHTVVPQSDPEQPDHYMRIVLDKHGFVQSLTYFGHEDFGINNYLSLFGLHEKYLNNLYSRFKEGLIPDLTAFLKEHWAFAIYHDRFHRFLDESRQSILAMASLEQYQDIREILLRIKESKKTLTDDEKFAIYKRFDQSPTRKSVDKLTDHYIKSVLPGYDKEKSQQRS